MPQFLSDEWLDEVRKIRDEVAGSGADAGPLGDLKLNITVTGGPEGDKDLHFAGGMNFETGHIDDAPTKITVPYEVARAMFVEGNQQAAMQAFMQGQVKIDGDMSRLMAMQGGAMSPAPGQEQIQEKIRAITE